MIKIKIDLDLITGVIKYIHTNFYRGDAGSTTSNQRHVYTGVVIHYILIYREAHKHMAQDERGPFTNHRHTM